MSKLEHKIQSLEEGSVLDALVLPLHGSLPPEMQVIVSSSYITVLLYEYQYL